MSKNKTLFSASCLVFFLLLVTMVQAQVKRSYSGTISITAVTAGGSSEYVVTGSFVDYLNIYGASGIVVNSQIIDGNGNMYIVRKVNSKNPANLDVEYPGTGINKIPVIGNALMYVPTTNNGFPQTTMGIATKAEISAFNHFAGMAEEAISGITGAKAYYGFLATNDVPSSTTVGALTALTLKSGEYQDKFDLTANSTGGYYTVALPASWRNPSLLIDDSETMNVLRPVQQVTINNVNYQVWQTDISLPENKVVSIN